MSGPLLLLADVGGTNTRVALSQGAALRTDCIRRYANAAHPDLYDVLRAYRQDTGHAVPDGVCIDVAGPVSGQTARLTNRDWTIDTDALRTVSGAAVAALLNDLQAQGHALNTLPETVVLRPGRAVAGGNRVVVNVGTGFNIAPVYTEGAHTLVAAAEAGHASLPIASVTDLSIADFVAHTPGFAAVEDVLSGRGLERLDHWVATQADAGAAPRSAAQIVADPLDPRSAQTIRIFGAFLGRVCGDYALEYLAYGGIYLVGGVARALAPHLPHSFGQAYVNKGRFSDLVGQIGVHLVTDDYAGLRGCAAYLSARLGEKSAAQ